MDPNRAVLLIFTGGTISMAEDAGTGALRPIDFERLQELMPELRQTGIRIHSVPFLPLIDSSDVEPPLWERLAVTIRDHYDRYDGFVVLHGTDTMAYSASALSFMLENLGKPVIFTGSQLPIGMLRSDAKENLLTAIEIAADKTADGRTMVPEVCIFFEDTLFRANRTTKKNAEHFNAFNSYNYPPLAKAGVHIKYNMAAIHHPDVERPLRIRTKTDTNIAILKLYPGINEGMVNAILGIPHLRAVVLESFGAGTDKNAQFWNMVYRRALIANYVEKDIEQYGVIKLTEKGHEFLKHPTDFMLTEDHNFEESEEKLQEKGGVSALDNTLFAILKDLRKKIAKKNGLPPYVIFQDPSLEDMCINYPITLEELSNIQGVGTGKAQKSVTVPPAAVQTDLSGDYVYVVDSNNRVERRNVKAERQEGSLYISKGLREGELVIVEGITKARPGGVVTPQRQKTAETGR